MDGYFDLYDRALVQQKKHRRVRTVYHMSSEVGRQQQRWADFDSDHVQKDHVHECGVQVVEKWLLRIHESSYLPAWLCILEHACMYSPERRP